MAFYGNEDGVAGKVVKVGGLKGIKSRTGILFADHSKNNVVIKC